MFIGRHNSILRISHLYIVSGFSKNKVFRVFREKLSEMDNGLIVKLFSAVLAKIISVYISSRSELQVCANNFVQNDNENFVIKPFSSVNIISLTSLLLLFSSENRLLGRKTCIPQEFHLFSTFLFSCCVLQVVLT